MSGVLDDETLLAALGEALAPEPAAPGVDDIDALHRALAERASAGDAGDSAAAVVPIASAGGWGQRGGPLHRLRHPVAVAAAVAVLATGGVAAAAVATDHLPGPTRTVAYALGLPVTSPGLRAADGTLAALQSALAGSDVHQIRDLDDLLRRQIAGLSPSDRSTIEVRAADAMNRADALLAPSPSSSGGSPGAPDPASSATSGTSAGGHGSGSGSSGRSGGGSSGSSGGGSGSNSTPGGPGPSGSSGGGANSGGPTATTVPRTDDGSSGSSGSDGGNSGDGSDDGSGGSSDDGPGTTTPGGSSPTTTVPRGSGHGGSDDGSGGDN